MALTAHGTLVELVVLSKTGSLPVK